MPQPPPLNIKCNNSCNSNDFKNHYLLALMKKSVGTFGVVFNDNITLLTYKNTDLEQIFKSL